MATMLDFGGALAPVTRTGSVEEDLTSAWREVSTVTSLPPGAEDFGTPESGTPAAAPPDSGRKMLEPLREERVDNPPPDFGKARGGQQVLFDSPDDVGYRGPTACAAAGITYRQLDYWARTGLVQPSVTAAAGGGSQRLYGVRDILLLKGVKRLLDTGVPLAEIRRAIEQLREPATTDLAEITLMSDGIHVYVATSADEVVDMLQGGQGVFGIALGRAWREVEGTLADMPAERAWPRAKHAGEVGFQPTIIVGSTDDEIEQRDWRSGHAG